MTYIVFRDNVYIPFAKVGIICVLLTYLAFLTYNMVTPAYFIDAFFTNPSFFVALKFLAVYLIFSTLVTLVLAAAIYAYIEIGRYKQQVAYLTEDRKLLEVRISENTEETLASMEAVLEMVSYRAGEALWFPVWWRGRMRPTHSFEIVSRGGIVFFLINIRANLVDPVSSAIWAFYPKAQITETDDYTHSFEYDKEQYSLFAFEWKFDKNNALPIKTYVEFQLDKFPSPGKTSTGTPAVQASRPLIDPLAPLYDLLGSLKGKEQMWVQYVFRVQKYKRAVAKANDGGEVADDPLDPSFWKKQSLKEEIYEALVDLEKKRKKAAAGDEPFVPNASEERLREAGPRLMEKQALEVGIRVLYAAPKDDFNPPGRIPPLLGLYKLTDATENTLKPHSTLLTNVSSIPEWEPPRKDKEAERELLLQLYRDRLFWLAPALFQHQASDEKWWGRGVAEPSKKRPSMVMTTETLATICHFPTSYIKTMGVQRTLATVVEPPENLPV